MAKRTAAKIKKQLERRFGKLAAGMETYYHHLDFRLFDDFGDDEFAFVMEKVKGVNMLDLNETDITNESIKLLTRLESVKELRIKQCRNLDNGCIEYLDQLTDLIFLHLKSTDITIDGLLKLTGLPHLKELMFSADDMEGIEEKMLQLKAILPECNFTVNSRPYFFDEHE